MIAVSNAVWLFVAALALAAKPAVADETAAPEPAHEHGHSIGEDAERELSYLFGLTGRAVFVGRAAVDAILHYDVLEEHFIPEAGIVARICGDLFSTVDARATIGDDNSATLLPGLKYRVLKARSRFLSDGFLGLGYQFSVAGDTAFDNQVCVQLELGRHG
ncbi:MAG: hypothetical protein HYY13_02350 [Nitrospirae bacterium]|nr:hypothetical protein [Nitrospirota bacterium]